MMSHVSYCTKDFSRDQRAREHPKGQSRVLNNG